MRPFCDLQSQKYFFILIFRVDFSARAPFLRTPPCHARRTARGSLFVCSGLNSTGTEIHRNIFVPEHLYGDWSQNSRKKAFFVAPHIRAQKQRRRNPAYLWATRVLCRVVANRSQKCPCPCEVAVTWWSRPDEPAALNLPRTKGILLRKNRKP